MWSPPPNPFPFSFHHHEERELCATKLFRFYTVRACSFSNDTKKTMQTGNGGPCCGPKKLLWSYPCEASRAAQHPMTSLPHGGDGDGALFRTDSFVARFFPLL